MSCSREIGQLNKVDSGSKTKGERRRIHDTETEAVSRGIQSAGGVGGGSRGQDGERVGGAV